MTEATDRIDKEDALALEGTTLAQLDAKGRLALPVRLRDAFADSLLVATRHPDGCLVLYPKSVWPRKRAALVRLPYSARAFVRLVLGSARELRIDRVGRVLIPADLRALVGLQSAAALIGLGDHLELWDRDAYRAVEAEAFAQAADALDPADFSF